MHIKKYIIWLCIALLNVSFAEATTIVNPVISIDTKWDSTDSPYIVKTDLTISSNATLTINSGTVIQVDNGKSINVLGALNAQGEVNNKIIFESILPNQSWGGIKFLQKSYKISNLISCKISNTGYKNAAVISWNPINNINIEDITLENNVSDCVEIITSVVNCDINLKNFKIPYLIKNDLEIPASNEMIIDSGVVFKLNKADLIVKGKIFSNGSYDAPVVITSYRDNSADPDSILDMHTNTAQAKDWGGIYLTGSVYSYLKFTNVQYGGNSPNTGNSLIYIDKSTLKAEYNKFSNSGYYGITVVSGSNVDFGGGNLNSIGRNSFEANSNRNYLILNKSNNEIYAENCCWNSADTNFINILIYDKKDKSKSGKVVYLPFANSCNAFIPDVPKLILPYDNAKKVKLPVNFSWTKTNITDFYNFEISTSVDFKEKIAVNVYDTLLFCKDLLYNQKYYWRVQSVNKKNSSNYSEVNSFVTVDTAKPQKITGLNPENLFKTHSCYVNLSWSADDNIQKYLIEISRDSLFVDKVLTDTLTDNNFRFSDPDDYSQYFWHVQGINDNGNGAFSDAFSFCTSDCPIKPVPETWNYESHTGANTTILIRNKMDSNCLSNILKVGDAIGVFFVENGIQVCGGYTVREKNENMIITAWGDNPNTTEVKDGFSSGEKFIFKVWDSRLAKEFPVNVQMESGLNYFAADTIDVVKSIDYTSRLNIQLNKNSWNYISSWFKPDTEYFSTIFNSNGLIIKGSDNDDISYNYYSTWNYPEAYNIYSQSSINAALSCEKFIQEDEKINFDAGKISLVPFLLNYSLSPELYFSSIKNHIIYAVNSYGDVYSEIFNIHAINQINPGEAVKILTNSDVKFNPVIDINEYSHTENHSKETKHFSFSKKQTDNFHFLLIKSDEIQKGDEIAVFDKNSILLGAVVADSDKTTCLTVYGNLCLGDNDAENNDTELHLVLYKNNENKEYKLQIDNIVDLINSSKKQLLKFTSFAFDMVSAKIENVNTGVINNPDSIVNGKINMIILPVNNIIKLNYNMNIQAVDDNVKLYSLNGEELKYKIYLIHTDNTDYCELPDDLPAGVYLLITSNYNCVEQMLILKNK